MSVSFYPLEDPGVTQAWDELAKDTGAGPFARSGWFRAWSDAFATPIEIAALTSGSGTAFLPVIRTGRSFSVPVNAESPELKIVASDPDARTRLLMALCDGGRASGVFLKVDRETAAALRSVGGGRVSEEVMQRSPYLEIHGEWDTYEKSLGSSFRQGLRRKGRRLRDEGEVVVEMHDGTENLDPLLGEGFAVESSQWKAIEGTAIASQPSTKAFYRAMSAWAAERGYLRLWFMRLDGKAIAFRLDLIADDVYFHVKGGYEPALARYSPGLLLQHDTVKQAFDNDLVRYEFLGADEPYKLNWTKSCRDRMAVRVYGSGVRGWAEQMARRYGKPVVESARKLARRAD